MVRHLPVIVMCTFMPTRQICTKAVGVQITASVTTRNMMRCVYIWSEKYVVSSKWCQLPCPNVCFDFSTEKDVELTPFETVSMTEVHF